jgi:hypothetical protein
MALPLNANLEPQQALGLEIIVPSPRWTSLQRKLMCLSRTGITNFMAAASGSGFTAAQAASATEASLRAAYEGPLSATYLALSAANRNVLDRLAGRILGGASTSALFGLSDSALGTKCAQTGADDATVFRP